MSTDNQQQGTKRTLSELLEMEELHDITLKCSDGVEVTACRNILALKSPVFHRMLYGNFEESNSSTVNVGYEGVIMKKLLKFMHAGEVSMEGMAEKEQIGKIVKLSEAASFFHVEDLMTSLINNKPSLSCTLLNHVGCHCTDWRDLALACIRSRAMEIVTHHPQEITSLKSSSLELILQDEDHFIDEKELFQILAMWADGAGDDAENDGNDRIKIAAELSSNIRLEMICLVDLAGAVSAAGLFTEAQLLTAFKKLAVGAHKEKNGMLIPFQKSYRSKAIGRWNSSKSDIAVARQGIKATTDFIEFEKEIKPGSKVRWTILVEDCPPGANGLLLGVYYSREGHPHDESSFMIDPHFNYTIHNYSGELKTGTINTGGPVLGRGDKITFELSPCINCSHLTFAVGKRGFHSSEASARAQIHPSYFCQASSPG